MKLIINDITVLWDKNRGKTGESMGIFFRWVINEGASLYISLDFYCCLLFILFGRAMFYLTKKQIDNYVRLYSQDKLLVDVCIRLLDFS